ncbi:MAG: acyl carrier protein [Vigna little leaf phytoplasma]|nr:acyl carrier protein [Vigna little leaf phytoplasma]
MELENIKMVFKKIKNILSQKLSLNEDDIKLNTRLKEDLGLDSFDAVELVIELEKIFHICIKDEAMQHFKKVEDVVEYIKSKITH